MSKQTAVRIEDDIYLRLRHLAEKTGRTATFYIREAIEQHLEDLEDVYLAEHTLEEMIKNNEPTYPLDDVIEEFRLEG